VDGGPADALATAEAFQAAARAADAHALGTLIRHQLSLVDWRGEHSSTALHLVATLPQPEAIAAARVLVAAGVPIDAPDALGQTALRLAIEHGAAEMALFLLDAGADTDGCLHPAIRLGNADLVRELIDCGADLEQPVSQMTPLDYARARGFEEAARLIAAELQRRS
jgi:ankyrin repeat protein